MKTKYKHILSILIMTMLLIGTLTACQTDAKQADSDIQSGQEAPKFTTYEFETFDGKTVTIDDKNIISQKTVSDVAETDLVPSDAEVIAPGRDFIYLEDVNYYYVEDTANNLLTVALKE